MDPSDQATLHAIVCPVQSGLGAFHADRFLPRDRRPELAQVDFSACRAGSKLDLHLFTQYGAQRMAGSCCGSLYVSLPMARDTGSRGAVVHGAGSHVVPLLLALSKADF